MQTPSEMHQLEKHMTKTAFISTLLFILIASCKVTEKDMVSFPKNSTV
jgi:hypothetical protein